MHNIANLVQHKALKTEKIESEAIKWGALKFSFAHCQQI
jgi:hypothetical protein